VFQRALDLAVENDVESEDDTESKTNADEPTIDFLTDDNEVALVLTLSVNGIWKPEFYFAMLPVGLEKIDVMEAKLRDAQEEIAAMRIQLADRDKKVVFLSLTSNIACGQNDFIDWNETFGDIPASHFDLSADRKLVEIMKAGVYQVQVRLAGTNNRNTSFLSLDLNGVSFAQCTQSDANNHQNTPQITEFMRLAADDTLQVKCGANGNSLNVAQANRFSILYLGK
jgi:hypothetical protein